MPRTPVWVFIDSHRTMATDHVSTSRLQAKLSDIPPGPGVYLYRDKKGTVLYVGKAKSLKNRVRSYFQEPRLRDARLERMIRKIDDVEFIVTDTEGEALALENNLIKQNKPRYNVLLRDDKTYPYIKLTLNEPFPRAFITRRVRRDGALYFGPYFPAGLARKTLRLIERHFMLRNCTIRIDGRRPRPCLQHYIHRCLGPCVDGLTTPEAYQEAARDVRLFLEGRTADLLRSLKDKMSAAAQSEQYEAAAHHRDAMETVQAIAQRQKMASTSPDDTDIFGFHREGSRVAVSAFHMRAGRVVNKKEMFWEDQTDFDPESFFSAILKQYYLDAPFLPSSIHVPSPFEDQDLLQEQLTERKGKKVDVRTPVRGGKREMMELVRRNAKLIFDQRFRSARPSGAAVARDLEETLDLDRVPGRIDAFDISNLQGDDIVGSMVVWRDGRMSKSDYRRFLVRSVANRPDDFKSMHEVVHRRYRRVVDAKQKMPDLILIDGGLGQLHAAQAALDELNIVDQPLASVAKREETIYVAGRESEPIVLDRRSPVLHLIQQVRDESHRFAITFHRHRRTRRQTRSALETVPGIGPRTARRLLARFGSLRNVQQASREELVRVVNRPQADAILAHAWTSAGGAR